ncbi:hypothetical protein [Mediterraneibacter sp.]|jgi:hypothetical protein|uniref:hypothetical protein n=1 Tax=Mediterraneibacter sp. TaxID=2316022 RepID=UPI0015ACDAAC|nr:hypothetical protein [Mediterraneibacter sp.]
MILENNEEKRSTIWRTIITISSILVILVAVFFVTRLFVGNPLVGTWISEDSGETIKIESDGKVTVTDEEKKSIETVQSEVDTKTKVFTIHTEEPQSEGILSGTYDYSIEKDTLTLTEREYGDQLVFVRKEKS